MDKALACHAGSRGSNPKITKEFSAPIVSVTPTTGTLSANGLLETLGKGDWER